MEYEELKEKGEMIGFLLKDYYKELADDIVVYLDTRGFEDFDHFLRAFKSDCRKNNLNFNLIWREFRKIRLQDIVNFNIPNFLADELCKSDLEDELKLDILNESIKNRLDVSDLKEMLKKAKSKVIGIEGREIKGLYKDLIVSMKEIRKNNGVLGLREAKSRIQGLRE